MVDPATYQTDVYSEKAADFIRRRAPEETVSISALPRDPHAEAAACNCNGNNPRAAPRYEGQFAVSVQGPAHSRLQRGRRLGRALSNVKDLPLLTASQQDAVDARYRARAEAVLGVDDLVQNVVGEH